MSSLRNTLKIGVAALALGNAAGAFIPTTASASSIGGGQRPNTHYLGPNTPGYQNACAAVGKYSRCILPALPPKPTHPNPGGLLLPSDSRLKRDVVLLGRLNDGIGIYRFKYRWSDETYVGVIAQEVSRIARDAVVRAPDGYLWVNYARLGLRMYTWDEWRTVSWVG